MLAGWAKFHRSLFDHWIYSFDQPDKALAWIYLFGNANHSSGEILIKGRVKKVGRGQLAMSQLTLQKKFGWSQNKLKRFLKLLKNERMIDYETDDLTTLITICNYESFQGIEEIDGRPVERTDGRPVERYADDQSNDNKECNKNKNDKNDKKKPIVVKFSTDHMDFAKGMFSLILKVVPREPEPNFDKWADVIRLMNKRDKLELSEMANVFRWANRDDFWQTNIKSPSKFRKQYSTLHAKMIGNSALKKSSVTQNNIDVAKRFLNNGDNEK